MARKLRGFQRVLDAPALFSIAYGEIASSIYFALGIVAAHALGLTPVVLLGAGVFFLIVSLSYAEGTAAIPETGGAATFVRRAYNDVLGFLTGWALFLDYLIVIALSSIFLPHYLGAALGVDRLRESPWDLIVAVCVILGIAVVRLVRRSQLHSAGLFIAGLDLATQLLLVILGMALLFSPEVLTQGTSIGESPTWDDLAFALPLAMLAFTGLETVANLAEETREPGRTLPRSLFSAIGLVVVLTVARRGRGHLGFSGRERAHGARRRVVEGAARGHRRCAPAASPGLARRRAARLRRAHGRARAARRGDDLDLRLHPARVLARRARAAAARLRAAEPAHAGLAARDPRGGRDLDRVRDRLRADRRRRRLSSRASTPSACCSPSRRRNSL